MAKYENEGYCPCNSVAAAIGTTQDTRLVGLWFLIGSSVVCNNESNVLTIDTNAVNTMFSTDSIAFRLMERIVRYNVNADKISVYQDHTNGCLNRQSFGTLQQALTTLTKPELIVEAGSKFAVIISEDKAPNTIAVHFWDLSSCW